MKANLCHDDNGIFKTLLRLPIFMLLVKNVPKLHQLSFDDSIYTVKHGYSEYANNELTK